MRRRNDVLAILVVACFVTTSFTTPARAEVLDAEGVTYHLLLPKSFDSKKTYRLVVMVHGRNGQGNQANGEADAFWKRGHDVIVAGPNMPWGSGPGKDKSGSGEAAMAALLKDLRAKYKLADKYAIIGFSQGGYFVGSFAPSRENELLMASYYGSSAPRYEPKNLPIAGACGSTEEFGPGIKAWAEKVNKAGGYALAHVAEGAGHVVTDSMRTQSVDLFEKCFMGLAPRVLDQVNAKFEEAKKLEEDGKFKNAVSTYKSILTTKDLPDSFKSQAFAAKTKALLSDMALTNADIPAKWEASRKTVIDAIVTFPGLLDYRKLITDQRLPFRGSELDAFFAQAENAGFIVNHITLHMQNVDLATSKGAKGPPQSPLNRRIMPLLKRIEDASLLQALQTHIKKLPEAVE
ncbi:MAG: hypothetical protein WD768_22515 [Phycisphaeraceae bacterium]